MTAEELPAHLPTRNGIQMFRSGGDTCCARYPGRDWAWCGRHSAYTRGEQHLCEFHAGQVSAGLLPEGITADGRWRK